MTDSPPPPAPAPVEDTDLELQEASLDLSNINEQEPETARINHQPPFPSSSNNPTAVAVPSADTHNAVIKRDFKTLMRRRNQLHKYGNISRWNRPQSRLRMQFGNSQLTTPISQPDATSYNFSPVAPPPLDSSTSQLSVQELTPRSIPSSSPSIPITHTNQNDTLGTYNRSTQRFSNRRDEPSLLVSLDDDTSYEPQISTDLHILYQKLKTENVTSHDLDQQILMEHIQDVASKAQSGQALFAKAEASSTQTLRRAKKHANATMKRVMARRGASSLADLGVDADGALQGFDSPRTLSEEDIDDGFDALENESANIDPESKKISRESSSSTLATLRRRFWDDSDIAKLDYEDRVKRAANYVKNALSGKPTIHRKLWARWLFDIQNSSKFSIFLLLVFFFHMSLAFFEPTSFQSPTPQEAAAQNQSMINQEFFGGLSLIFFFEAFCVLFYWFDMLLTLGHTWPGLHFQSPWNKLHFVVLLAISTDIFLQFASPIGFKFSRPLRPFIMLGRHELVVGVVTTLVSSLPALFDLFFLFGFFIATYAIFGIMLFSGLYPEQSSPADDSLAQAYAPLSGNIHNIITQRMNLFGGPGFNTFGQASLTLFVLSTTENYPTVMIRAYENRWYWSFFFISFLIIAVYWLLNSLVAGVFSAFKEIQMQNVLRKRITERRALLAAFQLLDVNCDGFIAIEDWEAVLSIFQPNLDSEVIRLLFKTIDYDNNGHIDAIEFFELCDITVLRFERISTEVNPIAQKIIDWMDNNLPREKAKKLVKQKHFVTLLFIALLSNTVAVITLAGVSHFGLRIVIAVFLFFFAIEFFIRITAAGLFEFWGSRWHRFEFIVGFLIPIFAEVLLFLPWPSPVIERILLLCLCSGMLRLISAVRRFRSVTSAILRVVPSMASIGILLMAVFYLYAIIGMEAFSKPTLQSFNTNMTVFYDTFPEIVPTSTPIPIDESFNSFPNSLLTLFQILTSNDWQFIMYYFSYATIGISSWFFVSFFVIVVILVLNLLVAIVIESFVIQISLQKQERDFILSIPEHQNNDNPLSGSGIHGSHADLSAAAAQVQFKVHQKKRRWSQEMGRNTKARKAELEQLGEDTGMDLLQVQRQKELQGISSPYNNFMAQLRDHAEKDPNMKVQNQREASPWLLGETPPLTMSNASTPGHKLSEFASDAQIAGGVLIPANDYDDFSLIPSGDMAAALPNLENAQNLVIHAGQARAGVNNGGQGPFEIVGSNMRKTDRKAVEQHDLNTEGQFYHAYVPSAESMLDEKEMTRVATMENAVDVHNAGIFMTPNTKTPSGHPRPLPSSRSAISAPRNVRGKAPPPPGLTPSSSDANKPTKGPVAALRRQGGSRLRRSMMVSNLESDSDSDNVNSSGVGIPGVSPNDVYIAEEDLHFAPSPYALESSDSNPRDSIGSSDPLPPPDE